jgi:NADPH:quinone reductase-like Zn-dependent oxidoreductase
LVEKNTDHLEENSMSHPDNTVPKTMSAMVLNGNGGMDMYEWRTDWPTPTPDADDVLIRVAACGLNNTDVNTRSGWYSKGVSEATTGGSYDTVSDEDPTWGGRPITFPRIQGADICGQIVAVGANVDPARIGERVITDNWLRDPDDPLNMDKTCYFGSECDGGFAQYAKIPAANAWAINSDYSDAELATFSCSYSTAEGMLTRADVKEGDTVLVPGASGGVGGALVQLSKCRGARVIAMASESKHDAVRELGADMILPRMPENLITVLADEKITVVADVVGGAHWATLIDLLERGGRYVCSGAIAGPIVDFDLRTFYLRDLTFLGSTVIDPMVMGNLVKLIESGAIKPALAAAYPLSELIAAQTAFIAKEHSGNIVVQP